MPDDAYEFEGDVEHDLDQIKIALAQSLFEQIGLNPREAREVVDQFCGEIASSLETGESVRLDGLGHFSLRDGFFSGYPYGSGPGSHA